MQVSTGGTHTHHHGLLAGLSAGAAGVLATALIAWRAVGRIIGAAAPVIGWALVVFVVAVVAYEVAIRFVRLRYYVAHPETLIRQSVQVVQAQPAVAPGTPVPAIPAAPVAALPPARSTLWRTVVPMPDEQEAHRL